MQTGILFRGETRILDDEARRSAPGDFVRLPDGMVHYELKGPPDGQPVVLVHGFSVPYYIWDPTFPALAAAGLRVLRYDLFGRGFSDRPDLPYTMELFVRQLKDLLEALQVNIPVSLVGLSLGGLTQTYQSVAAQGLPILLVWGRQDKLVPFRLSEKACQILPQAEFHAIDQAGHIAHYEKPELVNPLLIAFLKRS